MTLQRCIVVEQDATVRTEIFTYRSKRGDSYKTNATFSILEKWGNNVTMILYYKNSENDAEHVLFSVPLCAVMKVHWYMDLVSKFTDIPKICPMHVREYHVINLELAHNNFPLPLPSGEHFLGIIFKRRNNAVLVHWRGTILVQH